MRYITSESVTEGHPDKICDQISDSILDAYLKKDPDAHVAIECMISKNLLVIAGEIKSSVKIEAAVIARKVLQEIGYVADERGLNAEKCLILTNIHQQSPDIECGVNLSAKVIGAGDQGSMYGYACNETKELLPLPISLAHALTRRLDYVRKKELLPFLWPDGKAQVTVLYDEKQQPKKISDIVVSAQHCETVSLEKVQSEIKKWVIDQVVDQTLVDQKTRYLINPTGRFVIGGPLGDTGLTGRKIIVDTYGGVIPHGGGAFSGKDGTKVDRSAAYMARYIAKNLVAAGLAQRCQIGLSYAIGYEQPVALDIDTFDSSQMPDDILKVAVLKTFDLSPKGMIDTLNLKMPIFQRTAVYGHFNKAHSFPWEKTDKVVQLSNLVKNL